MIGKIAGAFIGDKLAQQTRSVGGPTGAVLGVVAASVLRRMSLPAMAIIALGGYAAKKFVEDKDKPQPRTIKPSATNVPPAAI